jgi:uncharacterized RDD family membrane protein YckC
MSVWASWRHRPAPGYVPADGAYRAVAAPLWRRGTASALDWFLVFVLFILAGYPLGMIETLGDAIGGPAGRILFYGAEALALAIVPAYFAYFLATGHTLGMRALDIHVFSHGSGREPHLVRASARALLSVGFFLATVNAYGLLRGHPDGLTDTEEIWRSVAVTGALVAAGGGLWKVVDPEGRSLWDRLFGLVVVEDVVPASMPGRLWSPWGT